MCMMLFQMNDMTLVYTLLLITSKNNLLLFLRATRIIQKTRAAERQNEPWGQKYLVD